MQTIVWDVDDVLNDLMAAWFRDAWLPEHPACRVRYEEITENPPHRVLGIPKEEYLASLDAFRVSEAAGHLTPNPEILEWMRTYGGRYRHVALTARPLASAGAAADWVFGHFGNYVRCFGVVPSRLDPAAPAYDADKADFLKWFREADYFVDDSEETVAAVQKLGVHCLVYAQPWNRSNDSLNLLTVCLDTAC
jgi:FMN phosphatase YigB (HAD superfamily)